VSSLLRRFDRGFISPYFITDVKMQKVEFEKPLILLSEKISVLQDILPLFGTTNTMMTTPPLWDHHHHHHHDSNQRHGCTTRTMPPPPSALPAS
jgi:hypothetical protein